MSEFAGDRTWGASGAIGKSTSGRFIVGVTGNGAGGAGGIDTAAASLRPTAGGGKVIGVTLRANAGLSAAAGAVLAIFAGAVIGGTDVGAEAGAGAGASKIRKSSAPRRLSFQGKFRPGSPNV